MARALNALKEFKKVSDSLKSRKLICVATSALRDAPNKAEFIARVKKECGIAIKVIDGTKEAYYGALACANLLHEKSVVVNKNHAHNFLQKYALLILTHG